MPSWRRSVFENVVVGTDESVAAEAAVRQAIEVTKASGGTLHIVTAFRLKRPLPPEIPEEVRYACGPLDPVDVHLDDVKARASREHVRADTHAVLADPVEAISRVAREEGADLIVVGSKSHYGPRHLGNVPDALVASAPCAVLVV